MNVVFFLVFCCYDSVSECWLWMLVICIGDDYINSFKGCGICLFLFGEFIDEFVDYLMIWFSINVLCVIYDLVIDDLELVIVYFLLIDVIVNWFLYMFELFQDLVMKNCM